jgi:quercetin dioxygenase-like cupin family protein
MTDERSPALTAKRVMVGIEELKARHGPPPWAATLVQTDRYVVTVICQAPGHRNDWHYHLADECWSVYEGELSWTLEGRPEPVPVKAGEWILAPANTFHLSAAAALGGGRRAGQRTRTMRRVIGCSAKGRVKLPWLK